MSKIKLYITGFIFFITIISIQAGTSQAGLFGPSDQEVLTKRAQKYWDSKLTGDTISCYQLEEPSFRKKVPLSVYARQGNLIFKEVKVDKVIISDDNATVIVKIKYIIPALGSKLVFPSTVKDKWKKEDGIWYHVHEPKDLIERQKINKKERR